MVRLSLKAPLHCTSQGVFVFIISLEALLWASRGSGETLAESSPALYLTRSLCLQHESWGPSESIKRQWWNSHWELLCILPHRESLCLHHEAWCPSVSINGQWWNSRCKLPCVVPHRKFLRLQHEFWDPSVSIKRQWWGSCWELPCIIPHRESLHFPYES